uniref:ZP domain-containing protein n=1 Tax=Romanomermis culicivorax TaxID=13658 RepID=A0A915KRA6_ROMCU
MFGGLFDGGRSFGDSRSRQYVWSPLVLRTATKRKDKRLSPNGIAFENTIIVQFHRHMVTLGDKSFNVRCFYAESETTVESKFEVSMIPTGLIQHDMQMPNCIYSVRGQTLNGPLIKSAEVGATVFHKWECKGGSGK